MWADWPDWGEAIARPFLFDCRGPSRTYTASCYITAASLTQLEMGEMQALRLSPMRIQINEGDRVWMVIIPERMTTLAGSSHFRCSRKCCMPQGGEPSYPGGNWSAGRPAALPLGPLAADVSKQRSDRWQLYLACPRLHGLPILQPLASPRAAQHANFCTYMPRHQQHDIQRPCWYHAASM